MSKKTEKLKKSPPKPKTFEEIKAQMDEFNKKHGRKVYISRGKLGFCKNEGCPRRRRPKSAYCGKDR